MEHSKQLNFDVMEWHRGELVSIMTTDKNKPRKPKVVKITQKSADELNRDFSKLRNTGVKIKYVPSKIQAPKPEEIVVKEFNYKVANRSHLVHHCKVNNIPFGEDDLVKELRKKIENHSK